MFCFFGHILSFSNCVHHLGHVLSFNLDDSEDINRVSMDMSRKVNYLLHTFKSCSPLVKTFLFTSHCLSLYGAVSWFLWSKQIKCLEATFNNVLRKIWNLPKLCHTRILHCVAGVQSVYNTLVHLSSSAFGKAIASGCGLIRHCFLSTLLLVLTFVISMILLRNTLMMISPVLISFVTFVLTYCRLILLSSLILLCIQFVVTRF